jgi:hypothetical protein
MQELAAKNRTMGRTKKSKNQEPKPMPHRLIGPTPNWQSRPQSESAQARAGLSVQILAESNSD